MFIVRYLGSRSKVCRCRRCAPAVEPRPGDAFREEHNCVCHQGRDSQNYGLYEPSWVALMSLFGVMTRGGVQSQQSWPTSSCPNLFGTSFPVRSRLVLSCPVFFLFCCPVFSVFTFRREFLLFTFRCKILLLNAIIMKHINEACGCY